MRAQHGAQHGSQAAGCECVWVAQPKWHGVKMACVKVSEESRVGARRRPARVPFMYELGHVTCGCGALCATLRPAATVATRSVSPAVQFTRCVAVRTVLRKVSGRGTRLESRWVPAIFFVSRAGGPRAVGPRRVYAIGYTAPDRRYHYGHGPHTVYLYRKGRPGYPPEPPARATTVRYRPGVLYFLPYSDRCQSVKADWLQTDPYVCHGGGGGDR